MSAPQLKPVFILLSEEKTPLKPPKKPDSYRELAAFDCIIKGVLCKSKKKNPFHFNLSNSAINFLHLPHLSIIFPSKVTFPSLKKLVVSL